MLLPLETRIKVCLAKHPEWESIRITKAIVGARLADVEAIRGGTPVLARPEAPAKEAPPFSGISLSVVRDRLDVAAMIRKQIGNIPRGQLLPEDEVCRLTAGRDRNRFRRAVDNNPDLARAHRIRLRLDDSTEGKFYWGHEADVQEAARLRDL